MVCIPFFLSTVGVDVYRLCLKLFSHSHPEDIAYQELIHKIDKYYEAQIHGAAVGFKFFLLKKHPEHSWKQWTAELKRLVTCRFKCSCGLSYSDVVLHDAFTQNVSITSICSAILKLPDLGLKTVLSTLESQSIMGTSKVDFEAPFISLVHSAQGTQCPTHGNVKVNKSRAQTNSKSKGKTFWSCGTQGVLLIKMRKSIRQCFANNGRKVCPWDNAKCITCAK
ncbi:uncharacterized protein LOC126234627 [Schistocerca nitens]|uniref:uncharacterized protein LOC126234627 n=1 Tax=Schistocerca nitens TaxID=7011 RepID=UPI00211946E5|nr:uncharacterized protein LOC126234627 [Schistocerca nitens]